MKREIRFLIGMTVLVSLTAPPAAASLMSSAVQADSRAPSDAMQLAAFGDGSSTGSRHSKRNSSGGASSKPIEPSHADLHGATRESADKAYRKQYGF